MHILFENEDLLVVEKAVGIAVIPERRDTAPCLLHLLETMRDERLYVVHRLDKEVSGVLLFARNAHMHRHLSLAFEQRRVRKSYLALVHGQLTREEGTVDAPIRIFGSGRMGVDALSGKKSLTHWKREAGGNGMTRLAVFPVTGRRHQIRVHLYHMGHPIVGDRRYGEKAMQQEWPRLMLHAHQLECCLPSGEMLHVVSSMPAVFETLLR